MNDERYDYEEEVKNAAVDYIKEKIDWDGIKTRAELEEKRDEIYDGAFVADSVTGNASGSYFCNGWKAESALCHNMELLGEALEEFGDDGRVLKMGAESADVTIRCYLLGQVLDEAIEEAGKELPEE